MKELYSDKAKSYHSLKSYFLTSIRKVDFRPIFIIVLLMLASCLTLASVSEVETTSQFFTKQVISQLRAYMIGLAAYLLLANVDYRYLRKWSWLLYLLMLMSLIGLFLTSPIQNVHRWYRIYGIPFGLQPSEFSKIIVIIALSDFLERVKEKVKELKTFMIALFMVLIPFVLILKQPDLGSATVILPMAYVCFYIGGVAKKYIITMGAIFLVVATAMMTIFIGLVDHEKLKPYALKVLKEYQYERLSPSTYHQEAAKTSLALGHLTGTGWQKGDFAKKKWLPFSQTDSVYAAYVEEFGVVGGIVVLGLYFALIYFSFQITAVASCEFGRLLSASIAIYLCVHVVLNIGMMCGFLPITGVPLLLMSSGGSSILACMSALGILQSIYARRFVF